MFELPDTRLTFRGPSPETLDTGDYFTCVGAAQTFGCFCELPFPTLLSQRLNLAALNLGYGGAGPEFFDRHESLDCYINRGKFVIVQVMSGRSQSNSIFECRGLEYLTRRVDGARVGSDQGYSDLLFGVPNVSSALLRRVCRRMCPRLVVPQLISAGRVKQVVAETRRGWLESYRRFLARIKVPVVLLWFSKRPPHYRETLQNVGTLFGEFPHLVNEEMVRQVRILCEEYVECVTTNGSPQPLFNRFTGEPTCVDPQLDRVDLAGGSKWSHNVYYPSPEMHEDAATALIPVCEKLIRFA
jgi:hypothetical protein